LVIRIATRRRWRQNSAAIHYLTPTSSSIVQNAVRGFLELITFRAVRSVQQAYLSRTQELYRVHSRQMVLGIVPTRLYEFLAVTALCGIIVFRLWTGESDAVFFETLSLLALSAYRVMPAMSRINARLIAMRGQMHLLGAMENAASGEAAQLATKPDPAQNAPPLGIPVRIEIQNLMLDYHDGEPVVRDLTAAFEPGQINTITGASGCGKSTLVAALLGLHAPSTGAIILNGQELASI